MHHELLALYGGPDQIMGVTSGIATIVGLALMFWNKVLVFFGKIANKFHPSSTPPQPTPKDAPGQD
jgi:hypothetical protein